MVLENFPTRLHFEYAIFEYADKTYSLSEGVTETLKAADQMEWVRRMNSIRSRAEETVLIELVYD